MTLTAKEAYEITSESYSGHLIPITDKEQLLLFVEERIRCYAGTCGDKCHCVILNEELKCFLKDKLEKLGYDCEDHFGVSDEGYHRLAIYWAFAK